MREIEDLESENEVASSIYPVMAAKHGGSLTIVRQRAWSDAVARQAS